MSKCRSFTKHEDNSLRRMWAEGVAETEIAQVLGRLRQTVKARAAFLGLPKRDSEKVRRDSREPTKTISQIRKEHARLVGNLRHRLALGFNDPICVEYAPRSVFGLPIRKLDADTQALIDRALEERAAV